MISSRSSSMNYDQRLSKMMSRYEKVANKGGRSTDPMKRWEQIKKGLAEIRGNAKENSSENNLQSEKSEKVVKKSAVSELIVEQKNKKNDSNMRDISSFQSRFNKFRRDDENEVFAVKQIGAVEKKGVTNVDPFKYWTDIKNKLDGNNNVSLKKIDETEYKANLAKTEENFKAEKQQIIKTTPVISTEKIEAVKTVAQNNTEQVKNVLMNEENTVKNIVLKTIKEEPRVSKLYREKNQANDLKELQAKRELEMQKSINKIDQMLNKVKNVYI